MTAHLRQLRWRHWALVPGPADFKEPLYSTELQGPIAHYDIRGVANATLRIPGVQLSHAAAPDWWHWAARWTGASGSYISLKMTLFDTDSPFFGGFDLETDCTPCELLDLWQALRRDFTSLWLHSPDCRLYKPSTFRAEHIGPFVSVCLAGQRKL